jgi:hypothetical protein
LSSVTAESSSWSLAAARFSCRCARREGRSLDNVGDLQSLCESVDAADADRRIGSPEVDYLEDPRILGEGEFARLAVLPVGASRS